MRFLTFEKLWPKLTKPHHEVFTTFRFPWKNGFEYSVGDLVQPVLHNRTPQLQRLETARIIEKEWRRFYNRGEDYPYNYPFITDEEAIADGFKSVNDMEGWLYKTYRDRAGNPMIKYTLRWINTTSPRTKPLRSEAK